MSAVAAGVEGELVERDESLSALGRMLASVQSEAAGRLVWLGG